MPRTKQFVPNEVLKEALNLFWEQGYHATSIQDLIDHLGINRASLYDTFGGKQMLYKSAVKRYLEMNTETLERTLAKYPSAKEGLLHLFYQNIDNLLSESQPKGCFLVNATTELLPGNKEMNTIISANREKFQTIFYNYLKHSEEIGKLPRGKDLSGIASMIYMLYSGLNVIIKTKPEAELLKRTFDAALTVLD